MPEIRVIGPDGKQVGVMKTREALDLAKQAGFDLVEVSPNARPPVCRILDYGKYMYEQSKREKDSKKSQTASRLKEVKFRVRIEEHDYITKLRRAEQFLSKGSKLKVTLMFRGREMQHPELGFDVVKRAIKDLEHIALADSPP
ncbi:MAG: translation initiation factor IF-3, partial [Puniceicoccales bacterium]